ncbi:membrane protein [Thermosipho sp. 1063]|uniref:aspartate-alanine antiporter-like transporter n=1 Tax=unclassified Thermosipho (in: thermotogales) TaxID=2676525 RepID=UPI0009493827|nr:MULTISPECIES: hypothetical protein [unclassified Thermosipho (in: thermotogales)]ANQ53098.1 membrane protein [Thermosipho sp. 1070]APT71547.1 membrane protein [Thermosipho sp. 1063]OOC45623.1 membrane protein [Thermosipho sp. 1074]
MLNPYLLLFLSIFFGMLLGNLKIKNFKLGTSGTLFSGLFFGWLFPHFVSSEKSFQNTFNIFFQFSLILFVTSIGLIASKEIKEILKKYGMKFLILSLTITFSGFLLTVTFILILKLNPYNLIGVFSGSLTSSPGLATALESVNHTSEVVFGYTVGYIPGVLAVIFSIYLIPSIFKIKISQQKKLPENKKEAKEKTFNLLSYSLVIAIGIIIGNIPLNLGFSTIKLGITGGLLISSLTLGSIGNIGKINFSFNTDLLKNIQNLGLVMFLSSIGLKSGYKVIENFNGYSLILMVISLIIALFSIFIGFFLGKYVFKLDWEILAGAITGGMTSTPGLGAALESTKSNLAVAGYGATYPFALLGMVVFNKILTLLTF